MNVIKVLKRGVLNDGYLCVDYLLSGQVTFEILDILSQGTYAITGYQYLSPCYHIQKPENIQITGILKSGVIRVTYPAFSAGYIEEYLSALVSLIPEKQYTNSYVQTLYDDVKLILRSKFPRKNHEINGINGINGINKQPRIFLD